MDPAILRPALRIAVLVAGLSLVSLPFQPRDSAEFVVTVLSALVGSAFVVGIALLTRTAHPRPPRAPGERKGYNRRF